LEITRSQVLNASAKALKLLKFANFIDRIYCKITIPVFNGRESSIESIVEGAIAETQF